MKELLVRIKIKSGKLYCRDCSYHLYENYCALFNRMLLTEMVKGELQCRRCPECLEAERRNKNEKV